MATTTLPGTRLDLTEPWSMDWLLPALEVHGLPLPHSPAQENPLNSLTNKNKQNVNSAAILLESESHPHQFREVFHVERLKKNCHLNPKPWSEKNGEEDRESNLPSDFLNLNIKKTLVDKSDREGTYLPTWSWFPGMKIAGHFHVWSLRIAMFRSSTGSAPLECQKSPKKMIPAFLHCPIDWRDNIVLQPSLLIYSILWRQKEQGRKRLKTKSPANGWVFLIILCNSFFVHCLKNFHAYVTCAPAQMKVRKNHPGFSFSPHIPTHILPNKLPTQTVIFSLVV